MRALFVSSVAAALDEFHIDGFRVDLTSAIDSWNTRNSDGASLPDADAAGRKFLRELCQTVKLLRPDALMIAEDYSGLPSVTQPAFAGGEGFDARWYVDFYHHLVGGADDSPQWAKLILTAAQQQSGPLAMSYFSGALADSGNHTVVYQCDHDQAGGATGSARTIVIAANWAPLVGETRRYAEARCRFAFAMSALAAGTPLFLMGDEVGAAKPYTYDKFTEEKEDLPALRDGTGALLYRFYQDMIAFRRNRPALRSLQIEILFADDPSRVIAFRRWDDTGAYLVVGSLANQPYNQPGYTLTHPALSGTWWRECFNSDIALYGGNNIGNDGATLPGGGGALTVVIPANGVVVFQQAPAPNLD